MSNKVSLDSIQMITVSDAIVPAFVGALPTKSFTNLDGQFVGGGNIRTVDKNWLVLSSVTNDGGGQYSCEPFTGDTALSATRWQGVDQGVKWNFYLLDSRLNVIKPLYQNIVISDYLTTTTIKDAEILSRSRYFPRTTSYVSNDDLAIQLNGLSLAPDATTLVKGKGLHSTAGTNVFVSDNDSRVVDNLSKHSDSLATAVSNIAILGNPERVLTINSSAAVSADLAVPSNITLEFQNKGLLEIASGVTLTIGSMRDAGNRQVFDIADNTAFVKFAHGAVPHLNAAWWAGQGTNVDVTDAIEQMIASTALAGSNNRFYFPQLNPETDGGHILESSITIFGNGHYNSGSNGYGTSLRLKAATSADYMFKVAETTFSCRWNDINLDCNGAGATYGVLFEGTGGNGLSSGDFTFTNVSFTSFPIAVSHHSEANTWQLAQLAFYNCIFQSNDVSFEANSVNGQYTFVNTNFAAPLNGVVFDIQGGGMMTVIGGEFAGDAGRTAKVFVVSGSHVCINVIGCQDENFYTFLQNDASDITGLFNIEGCLIQARMVINQSCVINSRSNNYLSNAFSGAATGAILNSYGDHIRTADVTTTDGVNPVVSPPRLVESGAGIRVAVQENGIEGFSARRYPARFISPLSDLGAPTTPALSVGHITNGTNEDKILLRLGRMTTSEAFDFYYDIYRKHSTGWLHFDGNQTDPFKGFKFNAPASGVINPYDSGVWTDSPVFATEGGVEEAIQSVTAGSVPDGDKGDITVSSSGAAWTIDAGAVTYAKLQDVSATSRVLGRKTSGAGDAEELTLSDVLDFIGSAAQGDILYRGASGWVRLAAGTSGHYLQTQGTGANPQWAAAGGGLSGLGSTDNAVPRTDGTGGATLQASGVTIDDSNHVSGVGNLNFSGRLTSTDPSGDYLAFGDTQFGDVLGTGYAITGYNISTGFRFRDNAGNLTAGIDGATKTFWSFKGADVASAAAIVPTGNLFHVTGTTTITSITATGITAGTEITIIFDGALTFTDGSNLKLAGDFTTAANSTITLIYDGSNFYEKCRSTN